MALKVIEGSLAVAEAVKLCRPQVISAYPITPQTHIVEELSEMVANGELKADFVNVESEHSAASVVLGASATGARAYSATTSQGLLLMTEVLYNIAGLRLPIVLTCTNRAISAPLNIWNDQQDSISVRDSGWIQIYAEDNQEAADMHIQAYKIAENPNILLPVMVCMDGFLLTHTYEPVEILTQEDVDKFLPARYKPRYHLTAHDPLTFGAFCEPHYYMEARYNIFAAMERSREEVVKAAEDFARVFGRGENALVEGYFLEDAETVFVAMGSLVSELRDVVDELREEGKRVGLLKIRTFRPFPREEVVMALKNSKRIAVLEKAVSMGYGGILTPEIKGVFYGKERRPIINGFIIGLGGRNIPPETLKRIANQVEKTEFENEFVDMDWDLVEVTE